MLYRNMNVETYIPVSYFREVTGYRENICNYSIHVNTFSELIINPRCTLEEQSSKPLGTIR